jgi:glyoxylase-like metal-dependent hydrolase (beta-lactamase superfamily II)/rhodanese-related sulfurtransferase
MHRAAKDSPDTAQWRPGKHTPEPALPQSAMQPLQLFDSASCTYTYLLFDPLSREALVIDPVDEQLDRDLAQLQQYGLHLAWAVETHAHADHITSAGKLAEHTGARTAAPQACGVGTAVIQLHDGDLLEFGAEHIRALHTPGHTGGSMSFLWRDHVFTGDTLLINGCGRTDFQSGSVDDLYRSLTGILFSLPDDTTVWPGHDYQGRTCSSIGAEKRGNARVAGKTLEEFRAVMMALKLPQPKRMAQALPANLRSGLAQEAGAVAGESVIAAEGYCGDITPQLACSWWQEGVAVLVDVRSDAEREWVGFVPGAVAVAWKQWPGMAPNAAFDQAIVAAVPAGKKAVLLCRSGVRSIAAARRACELGVEAYNILDGFEGPPNGMSQRGQSAGWRFCGLPWRQG